MPSKLSDSLIDNSKRRRVEGDNGSGNGRERKFASNIFAPFRSLGHVTNSVPFSVSTLGQSYIITTCIGKSFQIYDAGSLRLLFVSSPETEVPITALSSHFHFVYAIWGSKIGVFRRGRREYEIDSKSPTNLQKILIFGDYICASSDDSIYVFQFKTSDKRNAPELYTVLTLPPGAGDIVKLCHPHTYLNKILVATESYLFLYNVRTGKLVFQSAPFDSMLTDIDIAPALDTVGLAFSDGRIQAFNLRYNKVLMEISCRQRISSVSFRTDGTAHLGVGTVDGDLYFYDLNRKKRVHILRDVHSASSGGVSRIAFLNGQAMFVTSGGDNSLKEYVFDPELSSSSSLITSPPRLLRSRGGHSQAPSKLQFIDDSGHFILSASLDRTLWLFSLRKDSQSHEISQREKTVRNNKRMAGFTGSLKEKFAEITALAYEGNKHGDWENIVSAHKDENFARTWDAHRGIVGRWHLNTSDKSAVSTVNISFCGNFGIIGSAKGTVDVYNLQSGIHRKHFRKHSKDVTGVAIDNSNKTLFSCSLDGTLHFYEFKSGTLKNKLHLTNPAVSLLLHRSTDLLSVCLNNGHILIVDTASIKVVRELKGNSSPITAYDISADGRWLVASYSDNIVRVWDLPTGSCIDAFKVTSKIMALKMSTNGEWLATAHEDDIGINLWSNRTMFRQVNLRQITEDELEYIDMPTIAGDNAENIISGTSHDGEDDSLNHVSGVYMSRAKLSDQLITLSDLPRHRYLTMVNLDVIKQRNKPKEAPKAPKQAPFFLSLVGAESNKKETEQETPQGKKRIGEDALKKTGFRRKLIEANASHDYSDVIRYLKNISASQTELEIQSFTTDDLDTVMYFLDALTNTLKDRSDYELVQAWMAIFLKTHGDLIIENRDTHDLQIRLSAWKGTDDEEKKRINELIAYCNGVLSFLRLN
ncbi:Utp21 specific WD40 associated putative domain-containing protein [Dipodascopsis uninucleata]